MLGDTTSDIYLNDRAYWRNVPTAVWNYKLGGYQVLKNWLSYRERDVLGRALLPEEIQHFTDTARRIGGIFEGGGWGDEPKWPRGIVGARIQGTTALLEPRCDQPG